MTGIRDRLLAAADQSPGWRTLLQDAIDERDVLRRERDSACEAQRAAETELAQQMARLGMRADEAVREKVLATQTAQRLAGERDAALALLRECREFIEAAPMARDATRRKFPLCNRIDALLGDGGEAGR